MAKAPAVPVALAGYMTAVERAAAYSARWPKRPPVQVHGEAVYGVWMIGNLYRRDPYYGAYPHGLLDRILTIFPETPRLHLFSGVVRDPTGITVDIRPDVRPDIVADAVDVASMLPQHYFATVIADPPYDAKACEEYGTPMVDKRRVCRGIAAVVEPGGHLVWLDKSTPVWARREWEWAGCIGVHAGTNRAMRVLSILRRRTAHAQAEA